MVLTMQIPHTRGTHIEHLAVDNVTILMIEKVQG